MIPNMKGLFLIFLVRIVLSVNILFISPLPSPSHYIWNKALSLALIEEGHNVTILAHEEEKSSLPENYTLIRLEGMYEAIGKFIDFKQMMHEGPLAAIKRIGDYTISSCQHDLQTRGLKSLLMYPKDKFDIIIIDITFNRCLYPVIKMFNNPPVVAVTAFPLPPHLGSSFGFDIFSSYIPYFSSGFATDMTLGERMLNFIYTYGDIFYRNYFVSYKEFQIAQSYFGRNIHGFEKVERNIDLLLANIDHNLDYPVSLPPNIIPVGGLHLKPPQSLPKDLQIMADKAKNGFILSSFGTNVMFSMLSSKQQNALFTTFKQLDQTIFLKSNVINFTNVPENVIVRKWLPQNDLLGHPNIRLFISHGGILSTQESIYHGVPVVIIPFIVDQYINARRISIRQFGRSLDHNNLTSKNLYKTVKDVLENPIYRNNIRRVSRSFKNQPQSPMERAVFWIQYLLKHKSAENLVTPARDMPFYKSCYADVIALLLLILVVCYKLTKFAISFINIRRSLSNNLKKLKLM